MNKSASSYFPSLFAALLILFSAASSHAIDPMGAKVLAPVKPSGTAAAPVKTAAGILPVAGAAGCTITSVSPAAAEGGDEVVITGQDLSVNCSVFFQNAGGGEYGKNIQVIDPMHLKVTVPFLKPGTGTLAVQARNSAMAANPVQTGHVVPFEVRQITPVIVKASQPSALPGTKILLTCSNLHLESGVGYSAVFTSSKGLKAMKPAESLNATTLRVEVPDMESLSNTQMDMTHADTVFIKRSYAGNEAASNYVPFKATPLPQCTVKSVDRTYAMPGQYVALTGSRLCKECDVVFWGADGKAYPVIVGSKWGDCGSSLSAQVPRMPGGKGFISTGPAGSPKAGGTVPIEVVPALPMSNRVDYEYLDNLIAGQQKVLSRPSWKRYTSPGTTQPLFQVNGNYMVYRNGDVYTYIYDAEIYEPVTVTYRYIDLSVTWADLDDPSLKYGAIGLRQGDIVPCGGREFRTNFIFSGCGKPLKRTWMYLQSKRPPVLGTVVFRGTSTDRPCEMYDAYVPAP